VGAELFFYDRKVTKSFPSYREQDCTREHCDEIKGNLQIEEKFIF